MSYIVLETAIIIVAIWLSNLIIIPIKVTWYSRINGVILKFLFYELETITKDYYKQMDGCTIPWDIGLMTAKQWINKWSAEWG